VEAKDDFVESGETEFLKAFTICEDGLEF